MQRSWRSSGDRRGGSGPTKSLGSQDKSHLHITLPQRYNLLENESKRKKANSDVHIMILKFLMIISLISWLSNKLIVFFLFI